MSKFQKKIDQLLESALNYLQSTLKQTITEWNKKEYAVG